MPATSRGGRCLPALFCLALLPWAVAPARAASTAPPSEPARTSPCLASSTVHTGAVPWAQRRLRPTRTWQLARGNGVVVAVLGSGIDSRNGQFAAGQVLPGRDLLGAGPADDDCDGSGTFVAGLVAARPDPSTTVVGMAPDAVLLPVRIMQTTANASDPPSAALVAQGIDYAVAAQADIVVVYEAAAGASDRLERAVAAAHLAGVIVVAGGRSARSTQDDGAMLYP